jgi:hypothetical protein
LWLIKKRLRSEDSEVDLEGRGDKVNVGLLVSNVEEEFRKWRRTVAEMLVSKLELMDSSRYVASKLMSNRMLKTGQAIPIRKEVSLAW